MFVRYCVGTEKKVKPELMINVNDEFYEIVNDYEWMDPLLSVIDKPSAKLSGPRKFNVDALKRFQDLYSKRTGNK